MVSVSSRLPLLLGRDSAVLLWVWGQGQWPRALHTETVVCCSRFVSPSVKTSVPLASWGDSDWRPFF